MKPTIILIIAAITISFAQKKNVKFDQPRKSTGSPYSTILNINRISAWYSANGESERNPNNANAGLSFPRGTSNAVYASGLMIGTVATDGIEGPRVTGYSYTKGFRPGAILGIRTGVIENPNDPNVRIWRVRRDFATADLKKDAAELYLMPFPLEDNDYVVGVRNQYKKDWLEWPASKGAPFYDANNDGIYTPQFEIKNGIEVPKLYPLADEPGIAKADQVIWYVCNDLGMAESPWKTKALGLEQQVTIWGYSSKGVQENILFKKFKLIYKGTSATPDNSLLTQTYLAHWSDPDLGDLGDDYVGCDTALGLGYVYNGKILDTEYKKFNLAPPSIGYDFLQGPIISSPSDTAVFDFKKRAGYKNLPMTSFISMPIYSDEPFGRNAAIQMYQMLRGLPPTPQGPPDPNPIIDPITKLPTKFWLLGDPISRTGWIDGLIDCPGDRRMLHTTGPFTMALGDTQEIVVGVIGASGRSNLHSVALLKEYSRSAQFIYDTQFNILPPNVQADAASINATQTVVSVKAYNVSSQLSSLIATLGTSTIQLFDDGQHGDNLANDGVFANQIIVSPRAEPLSVDLSFSYNGESYSIPKIVERVTIAGPVSIAQAPIVFDNINNDGVANNGEYVRFGVDIINWTGFNLNDISIQSLNDFDGIKLITCSGIKANNIFKQDYDPNSSTTYFSFRLPNDFSQSAYSIPFFLSDNKGNTWNAEAKFPVTVIPNYRDTLLFMGKSIVGTNDARISYVLYDSSVVGQTFEIWFGNKNWTVVKKEDSLWYSPMSVFLLPQSFNSSENSLPVTYGTGTFALNVQNDSISYTISTTGLTGSLTEAYIYFEDPFWKGVKVKQLDVSGNLIKGFWTKNDASEKLNDTLLTHFKAGNLYVIINTDTKPAGEIYGQILHGIIQRKVIPSATRGYPEDLNYESILNGFSLYVDQAPIGMKSVIQTLPTREEIRTNSQTKKYYSIYDSIGTNFVGSKKNIDTITIHFNNQINWALASPSEFSTIPPSAYFFNVPFSVYKDTTRVWPIVYDKNLDHQWDVKTNRVYDGKPIFERIMGITDIKDNSNNDIRYYSPSNSIFPPNNNVVKGRLLNGINYISQNIYFVNESADSIPPPSGTVIQFVPFREINVGDITSFTLAKNPEKEIPKSLPTEISLSQNYPNPFNPTTTIEFELPSQSIVALKIYDVIGREITTLLNEVKPPGRFTVVWNGKNYLNRQVASGVYFYRLETRQKGGGQSGSFLQTKKMVLLK